ncbi:MAG: hypothetical protein V3U75_13100 [Methylococcaceae bacterium]
MARLILFIGGIKNGEIKEQKGALPAIWGFSNDNEWNNYKCIAGNDDFVAYKLSRPGRA